MPDTDANARRLASLHTASELRDMLNASDKYNFSNAIRAAIKRAIELRTAAPRDNR